MRFATLRTGSTTTAARIDGDTAVALPFPDVGALLASGDLDVAADTDGATIALDQADYAPLVLQPPKTICVGVNYADHVAEMGRTPPDAPTYFAKYARSLIGADDDIWLPDPELSTHCDAEAELVVVVGTHLRHASPADALAAVGGYTVGNDFSIRDFQRRTTQFLGGKMFEHGSPLGPHLVTADELGDGSGLAISSSVNGVEKQSSNTEHLIFGVIDILVDLSQIITLEPGDVIFTGTPGGVGAARTPPEWLTAGDILTTTVEAIGTCTNPCVITPTHQ